MNIKALFDKNKYSLYAFVLLASLTLIYDGFISAPLFACRLLLCAVAALFLSSSFKKGMTIPDAVTPAFFILSLISCNVIFLTTDVHILLSLSAFFLALFFSEKSRFLSPIFAGLCVLSQPLTLLMLVPTIVIIQLAKKQKLLAVFSAVIGVTAFVLTKFLENIEFYADQFSSYYLSLHIFHLSTTHKEILIQFLLCSIPLLLIGAFYLIKLFMNGEKAVGIALILAVALAIFGFMLSKNVQTVIMIIVPLFAAVVTLNDKAREQISQFFAKHVFLFLLAVALVAVAPMVLGTLPYDSELFSRSTFIIFREQ
ncbi:MAG: hypothetical protein J6K64_07320 [Clostridia bacterium]|nr:hypothetical protein [Clostridia bacterium]